MAVPLFLDTIEKTDLSTWLRESPSPFGFYFILAVHTIGLAMLVGPNAAIDLRLLGVGHDIPLAPLKSWFKIMWIGFRAQFDVRHISLNRLSDEGFHEHRFLYQAGLDRARRMGDAKD